MQSQSLQDGSVSTNHRTSTDRREDGIDGTPQEGEYFVAEDGDFLNTVAAALDQLTADCKNALRSCRDDADTDAAIQAAELSFFTIAAICKEAGLAVSTELICEGHSLDALDCVDNTVDIFALTNPTQEPTSSWADEPLKNAKYDQDFRFEGAVHPPPAPFQRNHQLGERHPAALMTPTEEIVEVELTDLLTQSHEEMQSLQRVFEARMAEAERTHEECEHRYAEEIQILHEEIQSSRLAMDRMKQDLLDSTTRKLEDMHSAITASQKIIETGMNDQARNWKSICQELVEDKRDMAQKVAEERGKYTALKAHLASHDDTSTRLSPHSRVRTRSARDEDSADKMLMCELSPSAALSPLRRKLLSGNQGSNEESAACISSVCSTPSTAASGLVFVPSADNMSSEPSSAEVSPTHSSNSSSSKAGKPTFRRYYLAQKRDNRVVLH